MKPIRSAETNQSLIADPGFDADALVAAAREAIRAALARHKSLGHEVVVWRNGKIVLLRAENIDI